MAKRGAEEQLIKDGRPGDSDSDGEDPGVRSQPLAPVEGRPVRGMPKRKGMSSAPPPAAAPTAPVAKAAFSGFSFGAPNAAAATPAPASSAAASPFPSFGTFGQPASDKPAASMPAAPANPFANFGFGQAPPKAAADADAGPSNGFGTFGQRSSPDTAPAPSSGSASVAPPATSSKNGNVTSSITSSASRPTPSSDAPPSEKEVTYFTAMRGLNVSLLSFLSSSIDDDPFIDLSSHIAHLGAQYTDHADQISNAADRPMRSSAGSKEIGKSSQVPSTQYATRKPDSPRITAKMPAPPEKPSWVLQSTAKPDVSSGDHTPQPSAASASPAPFSFGNFGQSSSTPTDAPSKPAWQPKSKSSSEASQIVQDLLADKPQPEAGAAPASNPFSFFSSPAPSAQSSAPAAAAVPEPEAKKPAPLFSFAPSGPLHPTTPDSKTFTPSKAIEDPSPAKLGKFGPGGSQPQLSFGGAKSSPANSTGSSVTAKPFSFGFGASAPAPPSSSGAGFSFGSTSTPPAPPASTPAPPAPFSFGVVPTPSMFSFGDKSAAPAPAAEAPKPVAPLFSFGSASSTPPAAPSGVAAAFAMKPFGATPISSNPSSSSIVSAGEAAEGADDAPLESGPPSVNLAAVAGEGEENEDTLFEQRGKLYRYEEGKWVLEGLGVFKLKKAKEGGKRRFLMRTDGGGNVVFNMALTKTFKPNAEATRVKFTGADLVGNPANYMLQVKTSEMARDVVEKTLKEVAEINK